MGLHRLRKNSCFGLSEGAGGCLSEGAGGFIPLNAAGLKSGFSRGPFVYAAQMRLGAADAPGLRIESWGTRHVYSPSVFRTKRPSLPPIAPAELAEGFDAPTEFKRAAPG